MSENESQKIRDLDNIVGNRMIVLQQQIQTIDNKGIVGGVLSLLGLLGFGFFTNTLVVWIPSSLILMGIWLVLSLLVSVNRTLHFDKNRDALANTAREVGARKLNFSMGMILRNGTPMVYGLSLIYSIALVSGILIWLGIINTPYKFNLLFPLAVFAIFVLGAIFWNRFVRAIEDGFVIRATETKLHLGSEPTSNIKTSRTAYYAIPATILIVVVLEYLILRGLSFLQVIESNVGAVFLTVCLQLFAILFLGSYFSSKLAANELNNVNNELQNLKSKLDNLLISDSLKSASVHFEDLRHQYLVVSRYDVREDKRIPFFVFYYFTINRDFLKNFFKEKENLRDASC